MKRLSIVILALVALFGVQSAKAWGGFGHGCIAYVAEQHLTPEAKEKCRYYLHHTLPYYASWMDAWRGSKQFKKVNSGHSSSAMANGKDINMKSGAMRHLINAMNELGDGKYKELPDSVVRQRLINLIHYVGDMHCPSHITFSKKYFPQYATKRPAAYSGKRHVAFHKFWDGSPGRGRKGWEIEYYAKKVDKVSKKQAAAWQSGTLADWGRDIVKGGHRGKALYPAGKDLTRLSPKENKAIMDLADEMAMQGAYRLAHVLNTIFADKSIETR